MKIVTLTPKDQGYPNILRSIASPPKQLFCLGGQLAELLKEPAVAIVGSRKVSAYGQRVTQELADVLTKHSVVIVSGLAIGVDSLAHQAAVAAGGKTIAVLPCGLDMIYPAANRQLAQKILAGGGALITEYEEGSEPFKSNFVARNRIVAGLSQALVITEAGEKSGSLHTASFALEQGREVCAVPGPIYSPTSIGTNNLIKQGAIPITSATEILKIIGLADRPAKKREIIAGNPEEYVIMRLMNDGIVEADELLTQSNLPADVFNQTLTMLEITGKVKPAGGRWYLT